MKRLATVEKLIEHQVAHVKTAKRRFKIKNRPVLGWIKGKLERATCNSTLNWSPWKGFSFNIPKSSMSGRSLPSARSGSQVNALAKVNEKGNVQYIFFQRCKPAMNTNAETPQRRNNEASTCAKMVSITTIHHLSVSLLSWNARFGGTRFGRIQSICPL